MAKDSINIKIGASDGASAVIKTISARTVALGVAMGNLATKAITGMINSLRGWVTETLAAENANVMLEAAMRGVGNYTPAAAAEMEALADAIQDETGASDESVKANIAMLTTLGVTTRQMGSAARGMAALTALKIDGSMAARALARALEGDFEGFNRIAPSVRAAATAQEKALAVTQLLTAGYEQQKANLQTVGGAWEALQGRLGDAREAIIGAVFDGLKLGKTFEGMQASVGRFLKSEAFNNFTNSLRDGAAYALDIGKALTAKGGTAEVAGAFGNIILGALKDGAEYVSVKISNAFSGAKSIFGETRVKLAVLAGTDEADARKVVYGAKREAVGGQFEKAVAEFDKVISKNKEKIAKKTAAQVSVFDEIFEEIDRQVESDKLSADLKEAAVKAQKKIADTEKKKADFAERTLKWEKMIEGFAKDEADAKSKVARNQKRLNDLAGKNVSEYISDARSKRDTEKERAREERSATRKLRNIESKEARGIRLSREDQFALDAAREQEKLRKAANDAVIEGRKEENEARRLKDAADADLKRQRAENEKNIRKIAESIDDALEVAN